MTMVHPSPCALCSSPSRYTCPRCSLRTCSAPCSRSHKLKFTCSGERDPAKFINLRDVGPRIWAEDYRWLEEGRRKVAAWGEGLPPSSDGRREGQDGKRGQGGQGVRMEGLRAELRRRGCLVDFMPFGMRRKQLNQSTWLPT